MKKVIQIIIVLFLVATLAGCHETTDHLDASEYSITDDSPFNTLADADRWGDESDFLRIVDMDTEPSMIDASEFEGEKFTLSDERAYGFVIYSHNTSLKEHEFTLTLSYPDIIAPGEDNQVTAMLSWGGDDPGIIADTLTLEAQTALKIYPVDDHGDCVLLSDFNSGIYVTARPDTSISQGGITTHIIPLADIDSDDTYATFFIFEALPAR